MLLLCLLLNLFLTKQTMLLLSILSLSVPPLSPFVLIFYALSSCSILISTPDVKASSYLGQKEGKKEENSIGNFCETKKTKSLQYAGIFTLKFQENIMLFH